MGDDIARPAGAGAGRPGGRAGRRGREVRARVALGQPRGAAATAPARELIELILRAQERWDVDRRHVSGEAQDSRP